MKPGKTGTMTPPSKPDNGVFSSGAGPALPPRNDGTELVSVDLGSEGEINNCAFMSMRNFNLFWRVVSINHTPNQTHLRCRFAVYRVLGPHNVRTLHAQDVHVHDSTSTFQRASLSLSSLSPLTPLFVSKPHVFLPPHRHGISASWKYWPVLRACSRTSHNLACRKDDQGSEVSVQLHLSARMRFSHSKNLIDWNIICIVEYSWIRSTRADFLRILWVTLPLHQVPP